MKKLLCILLCLTMVLGITACGNSSSGEASMPGESRFRTDTQDYITELIDETAEISQFEEASSTKTGNTLTVLCDVTYTSGDEDVVSTVTLIYNLTDGDWELSKCSVELAGGALTADPEETKTSDDTEEGQTVKDDDTGKEDPVQEPETEDDHGAVTLSDNWEDFTFEMSGVTYQLPCAYQVFADNGWTLDADYSRFDTDTELAGYSYETGYLTNGAVRIYVYFINMGGNSKTAGDCKIGAVQVDASDNVGLKLAGGITCLSTEAEIEAAYGSPSSVSKSDSYTRMSYEISTYVEMEFYLNPSNTTYNEVTLKNCIASDDDATTVSEERPSYLDDYTAPKKLSDDPTDTMFKLDGKLYQLPCPLSAFTDNGWTVSYTSITSLGAGLSDYGYYLTKDGAEISLRLTNFSKNEVKAENCAVSYVEFYSGDFKDVSDQFVVMAGGIDMSTSWSDIDALCDGWDRYDGSDGYYTLSEQNDDYTVEVEYTHGSDYRYYKVTNEIWNY